MRPLAIPLLLVLAGCPIAPDFPIDAGPDSGTIIDGGVDAGVDAGASGSLVATLTTSSSITSTSLAWNGSDLAGTSIDDEGSTGPSQVTLSASNGLAGVFKMTLGNLVPGATSGSVISVSYQPASGPDSWVCNGSSPVACTLQVTLSSYDGSTMDGNFAISFPQDGVGVSAQLSSGSFSVILP